MSPKQPWLNSFNIVAFNEQTNTGLEVTLRDSLSCFYVSLYNIVLVCNYSIQILSWCVDNNQSVSVSWRTFLSIPVLLLCYVLLLTGRFVMNIKQLFNYGYTTITANNILLIRAQLIRQCDILLCCYCVVCAGSRLGFILSEM